MSPLRRIAAVYALLFAVVTSLNYVPGLTDEQGRTLGLFDVFVLALPLTIRILMNLPHIAIGGVAAFTGFVLARRRAPAGVAHR